MLQGKLNLVWFVTGFIIIVSDSFFNIASIKILTKSDLINKSFNCDCNKNVSDH